MENMIKDMELRMEAIIEDMLGDGADDAMVFAMIKLMQDKASKMMDQHMEEIIDMGGTDHATDVVIEGTTVYSDHQ